MNKIERVGWKFDYSKNNYNYSLKEKITENYFEIDNSIQDPKYINYRKSAVLHKIIRNEIRKILKSETTFKEIIELTESLLSLYSKDAQLAFPLGISVNHIIMHDTYLQNDTRKLNKGDVVKIDLGIHINGDIIDSAFTHIVDEEIENHKLKPLLDASLDAVYSAIAFSGPDARIKEISQEIQEVIESYELEDGTKINAIYGFGGHNITKYRVHGEKLILCKPHKSQDNVKMKEGEIFAIETYASTGSGSPEQLNYDKCSHFSKNCNFEKVMNKIPKKNAVLEWVEQNRHGLPFDKRWIELKKLNPNLELSKAIKEGSIIAYPPIMDKNFNSFVAQFEHTIRIKDEGVEIFSFGEDY